MAATAAIAKALDLKEKGNQAFKNGEYRAAMTAYHEIFMYVHGYSEGNAGAATLPGQTTRPVTKEEMDQIHELKLAHFCNLAMCHMKVGNIPKALANCSKALAIDPQNVKALFRRGKCHAQLGALDESKADLDKLLQLDPSNKDAMRELRALKTRFASHRKKEQKKFAGMFDKLNAEEGEADAATANAMETEAVAMPAGEAGVPSKLGVRIVAEDEKHRVVINRGGGGAEGGAQGGSMTAPPPATAAGGAEAAVAELADDEEEDIGEPLEAPQAFQPSDVLVRAG